MVGHIRETTLYTLSPHPQPKTNSLFPLSQWIEEVRSICGSQIPVILVGCKSDLRPPPTHPSFTSFVSREQAERVAQAIGARAYKECSALKIEGVDDVFEAATRASMLMREGVAAHGECLVLVVLFRSPRSSLSIAPRTSIPTFRFYTSPRWNGTNITSYHSAVGSGGGPGGGGHRRGNSRGGDADWEKGKGCCVIC